MSSSQNDEHSSNSHQTGEKLDTRSHDEIIDELFNRLVVANVCSAKAQERCDKAYAELIAAGSTDAEIEGFPNDCPESLNAALRASAGKQQAPQNEGKDPRGEATMATARKDQAEMTEDYSVVDVDVESKDNA